MIKKILKILTTIFLVFLLLIGITGLFMEKDAYVGVIIIFLSCIILYLLWFRKKYSQEELLEIKKQKELIKLQKECKKEAKLILNDLEDSFNKYDLEVICDKLDTAIESLKFSEKEIVQFSEKMILNTLNKIKIDSDFEKKLNEFLEKYQIQNDRIDEIKLKINILKDLFESNINPITINEELPFNFTKKEILIYVLNAEVSEEVTKKERVGNYRGGSVRIAKGFSIAYGGSRGYTQEYKIDNSLGECIVAITSKYLYVYSYGDTFRVSHDKITSISKNYDGVKVFKDGLKSKPITINHIDNWFVYHLLKNAKNWDM